LGPAVFGHIYLLMVSPFFITQENEWKVLNACPDLLIIL
jgi:hypothetical protein